MVTIRLKRTGKTNQPYFRVVVQDKRLAPKGKYLEWIGHYNPQAQPSEVVIDKERYDYWVAQGAEPSLTVSKLYLKAEDKKVVAEPEKEEK
jgi:small subunit ribosomal protein S16